VAKSPTERINDLVIDARVLGVWLDNVRAESKKLAERLDQVERTAQEIRSEAALVRQSVEELKKHKDLWSDRLWKILLLVIGCLLTSLFALLRK
jgi:hypothetical protein